MHSKHLTFCSRIQIYKINSTQMSVSSTNKITSVMIQYQKYFTVKADIPYIFNDKTVFN